MLENKKVNVKVKLALLWVALMFYELLEAVFLALIIWTAWRWPVVESRNQ